MRAYTEACARTHTRAGIYETTSGRAQIRTHKQTNTPARHSTHTHTRARTKAFGWQFKAVAAAKEKIDLWETVVVAEGNW